LFEVYKFSIHIYFGVDLKEFKSFVLVSVVEKLFLFQALFERLSSFICNYQLCCKI